MEDALAIQEALASFGAKHPLAAQVVEMRWYGGLTIREAAGALAVSPASVKRAWSAARPWLRHRLSCRPCDIAYPEAGTSDIVAAPNIQAERPRRTHGTHLDHRQRQGPDR